MTDVQTTNQAQSNLECERSHLANKVKKSGPVNLDKWRGRTWTREAAHIAMDKSDDTIQLLSQDGEAVETVHKELLCMFSKYYAAALQGQFLEARAEQLKVQLDSMDLLLFKTWLYTGYLFTKDIPTLITFYVFADRTDMLALRRTVMRELARTVMKKPALTVEAPAEKEPVKLAHVRLVLDNLPESSPLCHWMFTYYCYHWKPSQPLHCSADYDDEPELTGFVRSGYDRWDRGFVRETALNSQDDSTDELFEMVESGDCTCCHDICNWFEYQNQDDWEANGVKDMEVCMKDRDFELDKSFMLETFPEEFNFSA